MASEGQSTATEVLPLTSGETEAYGEKCVLQTSASWQWSRPEPSFLPQSASFPLHWDQVPGLGVAPVPLAQIHCSLPLGSMCAGICGERGGLQNPSSEE